MPGCRGNVGRALILLARCLSFSLSDRKRYMLPRLYGVIPLAASVAMLDLDIDGWLVGTEVRTVVASFLASLLSALTVLVVNGLFWV